MCQVSAYMKNGNEEELLKENVTTLDILEKGLRITTLFEGSVEYRDLVLKHIDFSGGKVMLEKQ